MNKKIVHDAMILTAFTLVLGFVLGLVYGITKDPIAAGIPLDIQMEVQGRFRWPRNQLEVKQLTWQQFDWLMSGLEIEQPKALRTS